MASDARYAESETGEEPRVHAPAFVSACAGAGGPSVRGKPRGIFKRPAESLQIALLDNIALHCCTVRCRPRFYTYQSPSKPGAVAALTGTIVRGLLRQSADDGLR